MVKSKLNSEYNFLFTPISDGQKEAVEMWKRSRILFLIGQSGTGKTCCALGLALKEILNSDKKKLWLTRPQIEVDENTGLLPGNLREKLGVWMTPFSDVLNDISNYTFEGLEKELGDRIELVSSGMLRGRTVKQGVLIADESQNLTMSQMKCLLTRISNQSGRIILCGDPEQSDRFTPKNCPLSIAAKKLEVLDTVSVVRFTEKDQVRDPLINDILKLL